MKFTTNRYSRQIMPLFRTNKQQDRRFRSPFDQKFGEGTWGNACNANPTKISNSITLFHSQKAARIAHETCNCSARGATLRNQTKFSIQLEGLRLYSLAPEFLVSLATTWGVSCIAPPARSLTADTEH